MTDNIAQFSIQRIYTKEVCLQIPLGSEVFDKEWKPKMLHEIKNSSHKKDDDTFEVVLKLTITARLEDKVAFLVEVEQAGLFRASGIDEENLYRLMNTTCLYILLPYARETIDSLVVKGNFPAIMLAPINFDARFDKAMARAKEEQASGRVVVGSISSVQ